MKVGLFETVNMARVYWYYFSYFNVCYYGFWLLQDWLRFSVAFWHTFRGTGADPFGSPTKTWPWEDGTNSVEMAKRRSKGNKHIFYFCWNPRTHFFYVFIVKANFEFINKLGVERWCFHDRDIAPDGKTLAVCTFYHSHYDFLICFYKQRMEPHNMY